MIACGSSSRAIVSPTAEFHAGDNSAVQAPITKQKASSVAGPARSNAASTVSSAAAAAYVHNEPRRRR